MNFTNLEDCPIKLGCAKPAHQRVKPTVRRFMRGKNNSMAYATPHQIAETLLREFVSREKAINYAEKISAITGPLSADYSQAAEILRDETRLTLLPADKSVLDTSPEVPRQNKSIWL